MASRPPMQAVLPALIRVEVGCGQVSQGRCNRPVGVMPLAAALQDEVARGGRFELERRDLVEQVLLAVDVMGDGQGSRFEADGHVFQEQRFRACYVLAFARQVRSCGHDDGEVLYARIVQGRRKWSAEPGRVNCEGPVRYLVQPLRQEVGKVRVGIELDRFLEHDGAFSLPQCLLEPAARVPRIALIPDHDDG